jgi:hypothetical protein
MSADKDKNGFGLIASWHENGNIKEVLVDRRLLIVLALILIGVAWGDWSRIVPVLAKLLK